MRGDLRDGSVKRIVETGVVCRRREDRLRGSDERQCLRDVQRREMRGGAELVQDLRRDGLVRAEFGSSMHDAMAYGHWRGANMLTDCRSESGQGIALRLENTLALHERFSVGRPNVQCAIAAANALGASRQQRLFVARAAVEEAELQRRGATVQGEN